MRRQEIPNNDARPLGFTVSASILGMMLTFGIMATWMLHYGYFALVGGSVFGLLMLWLRMQQHDERGWRIVETWAETEQRVTRPAQQTIIRNPGPNFVYIESGTRRQYVFQPAPGTFANLLNEAINPNNRIEFSQRQAAERGWLEEEYRAMVEQLRAVGWLTSQTRNGAPVLAHSRVDEMREWLEQLPPYPGE